MQAWMSTRRELIGRSLVGGIGLAFGFSLPWLGREAQSAEEQPSFVFNTFVRIFADNRIEIAIVKAEMGQGVSTSLAMLIAEEMDADWSRVEVKLEGELGAFIDPKTPFAGTFGSTSVRIQYERLRKVGAAIRQVFVQAAATQLGKAPAELKAQNSWIIDANGTRLLSYGALLETALKIPLPLDPPLKSQAQFTLIGQRVNRKDSFAKTNGVAQYGIDVRLPGMQYAAVRQHKAFGSTLLNFAELQALVPANYKLIEVPGAIIAIGASYWQAQKILDRLPVQYKTSTAIDGNSQLLIEQQLSAAVQDFTATSVKKSGDGIGALALCDKFVEAEYFTPFLAHGAMEPLNCTASIQADRCEFWLPTQSAQLVTSAMARLLNRAPNQIKVNTTLLGGSFGRKVETDYVVHAALASQAVEAPVQLIWSRAEDTQHDFYRPAFQAKFKAGLSDGQLRVWVGKNAGPSIMRRNNPASKIDATSIDGFADIPYAIDHQEIFHQEVDLGVPVGFWRSVGKSQNSFFVESFIDEIAQSLQQDPLQLRISLLGKQPRAIKVLERLAEVCNWAQNPDRESMGIAFSEGFGSFAAMAVQVKLISNKVKVERLWTVVDCGQLVNLEGAEAQVQGAALYGLAAALLGKITLTAGKVDQSIFGDRPFVKLAEAPIQEVYFIDNGLASGGLGEVATPLPAPAIANALFRLTQKRVRRLPFSDFSWT
jgi:isoquinoline 1-oxidoreductase beta subunit